MHDSDDLFGRWLAAHRQNPAMRPLGRDGWTASPSLPVAYLCRLRLFWPFVGALLWLSDRLLRMTARLYFGGLLRPRATKRLLHFSGRFGEIALALMRRRRRCNSADIRKRRGRSRF